jgi:cytochrome P450
VPPRRCVKEVELRGYKIQVGMDVCVNIVGLHHRKDIYGDPDVFRPERWMDEKNKIPLYGWTPFSMGSRVCVGLNFSMMEQKTFLCELVRTCKVRFVEKKPVVADPAKGLLMSPLKNSIVFEKIK